MDSLSLALVLGAGAVVALARMGRGAPLPRPTWVMARASIAAVLGIWLLAGLCLCADQALGRFALDLQQQSGFMAMLNGTVGGQAELAVSDRFTLNLVHAALFLGAPLLQLPVAMALCALIATGGRAGPWVGGLLVVWLVSVGAVAPSTSLVLALGAGLSVSLAARLARQRLSFLPASAALAAGLGALGLPVWLGSAGDSELVGLAGPVAWFAAVAGIVGPTLARRWGPWHRGPCPTAPPPSQSAP